MRWSGRWRETAVAACLLLGAAGDGAAAELRRLEVGLTPAGGTARLVLSAPVRARVHGVTAQPDSVSRLYVDLPRGTHLGRGVPRTASAAGPITRVRLGMGEGGELRVVLDLAAASTYRVGRLGRGRVVVLEITPAAEEEAAAGPPPVPPATASGPKIVIDPGHGGRDPGAQGYALEKDVTLAVAQRLAALLRERLGADVMLTRVRDVTLPLAARTARANAAGADLFVSIHANASRSRRRRGIETYYLDDTNDRATIRLATMENGLGRLPRVHGQTDLHYILSDLVQVGKMEESVALAGALQRGLVTRLGARYPDVVDLGVKRGPFYVLVGAYMPCVLVEIAFVTHPTEGRRLARRAYRDAVADGLYAGVARFVADARRARTL